MRPIVRFSSDNATLSDALNANIMELTLTDKAGMSSDSLALTIDNPDGRIEHPRKGVRLSVSIGYSETTLVEKGTFTVDEVTDEGWPRVLVISARAAELRDSSIKAPRTRSFNNVSIGTLVKTIAGAHGLTPKVASRFAAQVLSQVDQSGESDLHLLTRIAVDRGAIAKPAGKYLMFVGRGEAKTASGLDMPTVAIDAHELSRFSAGFPDRGKYAAVKARYYDVQTATHEEVMAGEGEPVFELPQTYTNVANAQTAVDAKYKKLRLGQSQLTFTAVGKPEMQAEALLGVTGLGAAIDGDWIIDSVVHQIGAGYTCSGTAVRDADDAGSEDG